MRILISETPAKMFNVLEHGIIEDPEMNFLLVTPRSRRQEELERRGLYKATPVVIEPLYSPDDKPGARTTDSGYIYLEESVSTLRKWDNFRAIYIKLSLVSDPEIVIEVEIFPRQVGYGVGESSPDPDMVVAWLLAMPSPVEPGELYPCDDLVQSDFMIVMPG